MRRPAFLFVLGVLVAGCATPGPEEPSGKVVVIEQGRKAPTVKPLKPAEWFQGQIEAAELERKQGRTRAALERVHFAKTQRPPSDIDAELTVLLRGLMEEVLELDTITASVVPDKDPVSFGEALRFRIRLHNGTGGPVRIPARLENTSGSRLVLDVSARSHDIRAQVTTRHRQVVRELTRDIAIPPGGTYERIVIVRPTQVGNEKPLDGFRTYTVGGHLRAIYVELDGLRRWEAIRIQPATVRAFRSNWEQLAADPVGRIGQAIAAEAPVHLVTAVALVPSASRTAAVDKLIDELRANRLIDWAIFASLQYLTNADLGRDAMAWRAWWPRVRENYFDKPKESSGTDGGPEFDTEG
jgi:hypothetical protein